MQALVRFSDRLNQFIIFIGSKAAWLIIPLVGITIWDVITRKIIPFQLFITSIFGDALNSTKLQEMEWHLHTALFTLCIGFGYLRNAHVRVDLIRERQKPKVQGWIEFLGCTIFLIPYFCVVIFFAYDFALKSYIQGEISASLVGLPHRWIIKSFLVAGLVLSLLAGFSIWLRQFVYLFGPPHLDFDLLTQERTRAASKPGGTPDHA